jgi:hypothetical protein
VLALYAVQVVRNSGDFWPFSTFPMYSEGRTEWSRPVIREVPCALGHEAWFPTELDDLPGEPFSLFEKGVDRDKLRDFFDENLAWSREKILSLREFVGEENVRGRCLLIYDARGEVDERGVDVDCLPLAVLTEHDTHVNPLLEERLIGDARP